MRYQVRFTMPNGSTGHWMRDYRTREEAQKAIDDRRAYSGFTYTVEGVPDEPEQTPPQPKPSIGVMPRRVWDEQRIRALGEAIARRMGREEPAVAIAFNLTHIRDWAAEIVGLCDRHDAPEPGSTAAHHVEILRRRVKELEALAAAPGVPVGASEAPGEGGDSDRRRLEALERFLEGNQSASIAWWYSEFSAVNVSDGAEITAPTLAALADKLAEKEARP